MAKAIILDVLESTIGRYVENLDAQSLNVAVWSGKIELHHLKLNINAVNNELARQAAEAPNLAVPFRVVDGSFESLSVDVPWARLTSRPVIFTASGLKLILHPHDHLAVVDKKNKNSSLAVKVVVNTSEQMKQKQKSDERGQNLQHAEEARQRYKELSKLADIDDDADGSPESTKDTALGQERESSSSGFKAKLMRRVIENLQVEINNVKLEIEGESCSAGIVLGKLSIATTDEKGNRTFVDRTSSSKNINQSFLYKILHLEGLGVYCGDTQMRTLRKTSRASSSFSSQRLPPTNENEESKYDRNISPFILSPLSFEAKFRQSDCIECIDFPKYLLSSKLPSVSIMFTRTQLELLNSIYQEILAKQHSSRPLFPEYRPLQPLKSPGGAKLWWKYAVRCIGRLNRRRSWTEFFIAFQKRKIYIALYKRDAHHSSCTWLSPLKIKDRVEMNEIENDRSISVQGIMLWRNVADAQVALEKKKYEQVKKDKNSKTSPRKPAFSLLFGSNKDYEDANKMKIKSEDEPPIILSIEEQKELDSMAISSAAEASLTSDSFLCDIQFMLGSFKVDLITFDSQPLIAFEMGEVSSSFKAKADGSFSSLFSLSSASIYDKVTPKTLFPFVVRSLQSSSRSSGFDNAFEFRLKKSKNGDQDLVAKMVRFELVASPMLFQEMKRFLNLTEPDRLEKSYAPKNPNLMKSLSGSVDLFYDADYSSSSMINNSKLTSSQELFKNSAFAPPNSKVSDKVASAIVDAWGTKLTKKILWTVEIDVQAPVLMLPKSCIDPMATVLVVNLGSFHFVYGKCEPLLSVQKWFEERSPSEDNGLTFDSCCLQMKSMSLSIGVSRDRTALESIIEPISLDLHMGIENDYILYGRSRKCIFGNLPSISFIILDSHLIRTMTVLNAWMKILNELSPDSSENDGGLEIVDSYDSSSPREPTQIESLRDKHDNTSNAIENISYFSMTLQRLSVKVSDKNGDGIEANLISVEISSSDLSDGSSSKRIRMGCFWIIDYLSTDFPRKQRLIAHSTLPKEPKYYAEHNRYNIIEDFDSQDIFRGDFPQFSLADITITNFKGRKNVNDEMSSLVPLSDAVEVTLVNAKFNSLFIHWNPYGIKGLLLFKDTISNSIGEMTTIAFSDSLLPIKENGSKLIRQNLDNQGHIQTLLILDAHMEALGLYLNSALDDLPLFVIKMVSSSLSLRLWSGEEDNLISLVNIGDFRLETPENEKLLTDYTTILGLSPSFDSSLLCLEYRSGHTVVKPLNTLSADEGVLESCINVSLSPMRFVYIHAQIFTILEYFLEGVLGTITTAVASAAQVALEQVQSQTIGIKLFVIDARGFELVLPQAAYSSNKFLLHMDEMAIKFKSFPSPGKGEATLNLNKVTIGCNAEEYIIDNPVRLSIIANLAAFDAVSEDDRATKVDIDVTRAHFMLTSSNYGQMLKTLDGNIGDKCNYLRHGNSNGGSADFSGITKQSESAIQGQITHSGVQEIIIEKRMYVTIYLQEMTLQLFGESNLDPVISLAAVETSIRMNLIPDEDKLEFKLSLKDLVCMDQRIVASNRHFRQIIGRVTSSTTDGSTDDVFLIDYSKSFIDDSSTLNLIVGSPQVVVIPDAIAELLLFLDQGDEQQIIPSKSSSLLLSKEAVKLSETDDSIETRIEKTPIRKTKQSILTLRTSNWQLVLIDVGSGEIPQHLSSSVNKGIGMETVFIQGQTDVNAKIIAEVDDGNFLETKVEINGENVQVYTAIGEMAERPIQIVEPTNFTTTYDSKMTDDGEIVNFSLVFLSDVDMIISIQNAGLLSAISSCLSESFTKKSIEIPPNQPGLSCSEAKVIEDLASALERKETSQTDGDESNLEIDRNDEAGDDLSSHLPLSSNQRIVTIKVTVPDTSMTVVNDLQGLDEALFRVVVQSGVCSAQISAGRFFRSNLSVNILAYYFDKLENEWQPLLLKPWEIDFKASRGKYLRCETSRLSTTVTIDTDPCHISFSEQFIISLGAANTMWSVYNEMISKAFSLIDDLESNLKQEPNIDSTSLMKHRISYIARSLVTTLPYALENSCGLNLTLEVEGQTFQCASGSTNYFQFHPTTKKGGGGYRAYGRSEKQNAFITILLDGNQIVLSNLDDELGNPKRIHDLGAGKFVLSDVTRKGKVTVVKIYSYVYIRNETSLDFTFAVDLGNEAHTTYDIQKHINHEKGPLVSSPSSISFGIPSDILHHQYKSRNSIFLTFSTVRDGSLFTGDFEIPSLNSFCGLTNDQSISVAEVMCSSSCGRKSSICIHVFRTVVLFDNQYPYVEYSLKPRLLIHNYMSVNILLRTPMAHTISKTLKVAEVETVHRLGPFDNVEIYTSGPSIAISIKCADTPTGGIRTGWNKHGLIDIPLAYDKKIPGRIESLLPFAISGVNGGSEFYLSEMLNYWETSEQESSESQSQNMTLKFTQHDNLSSQEMRNIYISVENIGVDHTGDILFGLSTSLGTYPYSSFSSTFHNRRISLLPNSKVPLRLIKLTMEGVKGMKYSAPFSVENIALCEGGIASTPIEWEDKSSFGYFAYRKLSSNNQSEIHIIPEFIIYNGGSETVAVIQPKGHEILLNPGKISPLHRLGNDNQMIFRLDFIDVNGQTAPILLNPGDPLGLKIQIVKSTSTGDPLASIAIQTVLGSKDSRFVIKLGHLNHSVLSSVLPKSVSSGFQDDFYRFRIRCSRMEITLLDTGTTDSTLRALLSNKNRHERRTYSAVSRIVLDRFTIDHQRIFNDKSKNKIRSQFAVVIQSLQILDCANTEQKVILECIYDSAPFFFLCIKTRDKENSELIRVDEFDLQLAHSGNKRIRTPIVVNTSEAFLWSLLDIASRTKDATTELTSTNIDMKWDEQIGDFIVQATDISCNRADDEYDHDTYEPPRSDNLLDVRKASISPVSFVVTFKRRPLESRYHQTENIKAASTVNYFVKHLKFTVKDAKLNFRGYHIQNVKGPPDRLLEMTTAYYMAQIRSKVFSLLSATTLDDWSRMAGRNDGEEEYVEGDVLRATVNLAGSSAGFVLKRVGMGLGHGVTTGTAGLGNGIQNVSEVLGVGVVGAGVNSVLSGVGGGVGDTVQGVGIGTSKVVRGAGKGVAKIVGGVGGGIEIAAKGLGKGIMYGDGKAAITGLSDGVVSIGEGVVQGTGSIISGTASGIFHVGKGLFKGVKRASGGIGDAFTGKKKDDEKKDDPRRKSFG